MSLPGEATGGIAALTVLFLVKTVHWLITYKRPTDVERLESHVRDLETAALRIEQMLIRVERDVIHLKGK